MTMRLYLVKTKIFGYDEYDAWVVRAKNPQQARQLAEEKCGASDTSKGTFLDVSKSTCEVISPNGSAARILGSFNAG